MIGSEQIIVVVVVVVVVLVVVVVVVVGLWCMVYAVWCLLFGVYMTSADHSLAMKPWYNTIPLPFCGSLLTIAICCVFSYKRTALY